MKDFDVIVVGAGPAGMAAASLAAEQGAKVALLDEQPSVGGQIYRNVLLSGAELKTILGSNYTRGRAFAQRLLNSNTEIIPGCVVWDIEPSGLVTYSNNSDAHQISGQYIVLATGSMERPVPIPGWTLPGVMGVGAAQTLLKVSSLIPENAVLAGTGPLLYLMSKQLISAGAPPKAIIETHTPYNAFYAITDLPHALRGWKTLLEGMSLLNSIRRAQIPRYRSAKNLRAIGDRQLTDIEFNTGDRTVSIPCDTLLLHQGIVPNTQLTRLLNLDHAWSEPQRCFFPKTDEWGQSNLTNVYVVGDGAGITGAEAATYAGRISAADILYRLGLVDHKRRSQVCQQEKKALHGEQAVRPFLDNLYPPSQQIIEPDDNVIVCRCESVTAGDIRQCARLGCVGPNQTKAYSRCGMGPCQGRYCALTVTELLAKAHNRSQEQIGSYRIRSPIKPVTLGELASLKMDTP